MADKTYLLSPRPADAKAFAALKPRVLDTTAAIRHALKGSRRNDLWIARTPRSLERLLDAAQGVLAASGTLLALGRPPEDIVPLLGAMFVHMLLPKEHQVILDEESLAEVLRSENRADLFISGLVDKPRGRLALFRGDLRLLIVPFVAFKKGPSGPAPDWDRLAIADCGQTVKLGEYEASSYALLYEFDPEFRRRARKRQRQRAKGLGPSLRRLRILKRLSQSDFPPISAKTVARIEAGRSKPRHRTLQILSKRLGVNPGDIESY